MKSSLYLCKKIRNMKHKFDPEIDECEDFDLTEIDYKRRSRNDDDDVIEDYWLTDDAYEILEDVQRKQDREDCRISAGVIFGCLIVITGAILFGFRHIIWG